MERQQTAAADPRLPLHTLNEPVGRGRGGVEAGGHDAVVLVLGAHRAARRRTHHAAHVVVPRAGVNADGHWRGLERGGEAGQVLLLAGARVAGLALPCLFENALTALLAVNEKIRVGLQTNITVKVQDRWGRTHREAFGSGRR